MKIRVVSIIVFLLGMVLHSHAEKLYVVERERGALAVIENGRLNGEIKNLGNMNHGIVKFAGDTAYVIGRDGFISKIDTTLDRVVKRVKVGNSGIGFTISKSFVAVANYDPEDVVILDRDLNVIKRLSTDSRNVGIKNNSSLLIFSLMDKDEIWVVDENRGFEVIKRFRNVGKMPFDAFLKGSTYLVGMFKEGIVGILDLRDMKYEKHDLKKKDSETVFKIPHFGTWGIIGDMAFIPAVGERKVHVISLRDFKYQKYISLMGLPVFVTTSPDERHIAVNYSGDKEDFITIIDARNLKVVKDIKAGKRVMHLRFSEDGERLYTSLYFDNKVKTLETKTWKVLNEVDVPTPSGIFIVHH
jgi:protein NirF